MIRVKNITLKNFLSVGNATQAVNLDRTDLTLVLGENLDLGGDGSRNGVGKTACLNGIAYALFGQALSNIKKDNMINKTNGKNMLVSIDFDVDGHSYRIERGRKPNILKFYVDNHEQESEDNAQGDSRETQEAIEAVLGMSFDMFKQVVSLNTYSEPFLNMKANDQRTIIEQLLGITILSERADLLKERAKATKDAITEEEFRIRAVNEANKRIEDQIESLRKRQTLWFNKRDEDVDKLKSAIESLEHIDIEREIQSHRDLETFSAKRKTIEEAERWIRSIDLDRVKYEKISTKLTTEIAALDEHRCYACGSEIHDAKQEEIKAAKIALRQENALHLLSLDSQNEEHVNTIREIGELGHPPTVFYDNLEQALNHRNSLDTLRAQLKSRSEEIDPYGEQIDDMLSQALQEVSFDYLNELTRLQEHQDFLLKLLSSKDSFVRKKIIEQNLSYLNSRLSYYLDKIGLPHTVLFQNDLSVSIEELGRELDPGNLSRGETTRLMLSLSWAFRDTFESLYRPINLLYIDELLDNGLDTQGVENALGILKKMSRERNKSIWLVSHRDELQGRVDNILKVVKDGGFTEFHEQEQS